MLCSAVEFVFIVYYIQYLSITYFWVINKQTNAYYSDLGDMDCCSWTQDTYTQHGKEMKSNRKYYVLNLAYSSIHSV